MPQKTKLIGFTSILMLTACSSQSSVKTNNNYSNSNYNKNVITEKTFQVKSTKQNLIVPVGQVALNAPPHATNLNVISDQSVMNDIVQNKQLKKELLGDIEFPKKYNQNKKYNFPPPVSINWGTNIIKVLNPTNNKVAVYAAHQVQLSLVLPTSPNYSPLLYSPTLMPPNYSVVEASTVYWRIQNSTSTTKYFGVWDHISGKFEKFIPMDSTFQSKYIRSQSDGKSYYYTQLEKLSGTSNYWRVMLYNYNLGSWEEKYSVDRGSSSSNFSWGWDAHEPYFNDPVTGATYCYSLPSIKAKEIQVWNGSTWNNVDSSRGSLLNGGSTCNNWSYNMINNYYQWQVN